MPRSRDEFVWFDDVVVAGHFIDVHCLVDGRRVPLPVAILHPDCTLKAPGDVGRLGVPAWWAAEHGLLPAASPSAPASGTASSRSGRQ